MKKIENSFYEDILSFFKKKDFNRINNFIKNNLWLTPVIYIIGTIALLIRNKMYGLQFHPISLLQFAVIVVYLITFLIIYSLIEFNFISLFSLIKKKDKSETINIIGHIILFILYFIISSSLLYLLIDDSKLIIKLILAYFIFWPIFIVFLNNRHKISNFITIIMFITLIMNIPMSLGGLRGQEVTYHDFSSNNEYSYIYYGNYEGVYQFVSENEVILIPIDSGYIKYEK